MRQRDIEAEEQIATLRDALDSARSALAAAESRLAAVTEANVPMEAALRHLSGFICGESDDPKDYVRSVADHALSKSALALAAAKTEAAAATAEGDGDGR